MPLPLDLASVVALARMEWAGFNWRTAHGRDGTWVPGGAYRSAEIRISSLEQVVGDCKKVIRDQQRHIKNLEAELRPSLVRDASEAGGRFG